MPRADGRAQITQLFWPSSARARPEPGPRGLQEGERAHCGPGPWGWPRPLGTDPAPRGSPTAGTWENTGDNVGPSAQKGRVHLAAGLGALQHKLQTQTSGKIFHAGAQGPGQPAVNKKSQAQPGWPGDWTALQHVLSS